MLPNRNPVKSWHASLSQPPAQVIGRVTDAFFCPLPPVKSMLAEPLVTMMRPPLGVSPSVRFATVTSAFVGLSPRRSMAMVTSALVPCALGGEVVNWLRRTVRSDSKVTWDASAGNSHPSGSSRKSEKGLTAGAPSIATGTKTAAPVSTPKASPDSLDDTVPVRSRPRLSLSPLETVAFTVMRADVITKPVAESVAVTLAKRTVGD